MKVYDFTVRQMHEYLGELIAKGNGEFLVVVEHKTIGGSQFVPICEMGTAGLVPAYAKTGWPARDKRDDDGDGWCFIVTPEMLPFGFWRKQIAACLEAKERA